MTKHLQKSHNFIVQKPDSDYRLILFNDTINTFDYIIQTLIEVCLHELDQAEQCALIAHYKGSCIIKIGIISDLVPLLKEMTSRGLIVSIESLTTFSQVSDNRFSSFMK